MDRNYAIHELTVQIVRSRNGDAEGSVWVRLRNGERHPIQRFPWPGGAPTPRQLELLEAALLAEVHALVLGSCGVQGVLDARWEVWPDLD